MYIVKKTGSIFLVLIMLLIIFSGCSKFTGPSNKQLKEDMFEHYFSHDLAYCDGEITGMKIDFSNCDDKRYEAEIDVDFYIPDGMYRGEYSFTVKVEYKYYDNGGWKLVDINADKN